VREALSDLITRKKFLAIFLMMGAYKEKLIEIEILEYFYGKLIIIGSM
jgi:hypothetical protein